MANSNNNKNRPKSDQKSQNNQKSKRKNGQPQKRSTLGAEVEFFILNKNGFMTNKSDVLLNRTRSSEITKEVGKNMIEVRCYPGWEGINSMQSLLENLETLISMAEEECLTLCPLGTYPGKYNPIIRPYGHYKTEEKLIGRNVYKNSARCCGLHVHYALPWGVFNNKKRILKKRINSKHKQSMVNAYNFLVAADPALSCFTQSSPFYQGQLIGKDTRALVWRGDQDLCFSPSLYNNYPEYGELPAYQHTGTDLIDFIKKMNTQWIKILRDNGSRKKELIEFDDPLGNNWTPLRTSSHGTFEQRGMDMNTPLVILAVSQIIKNILSAIQEKFIQIEASDLAMEEPFKLEKKKIIIPPFSYVKKELQPRAFYKGLADQTIHRYCRRLLWLAKKLGQNRQECIFAPLNEMLETKKTTADEIISLAKKLCRNRLPRQLPNEIAAEIALTYTDRLYKEMVLFRELVKKLG